MKGKEFKFFSFLSLGGRGSLQSVGQGAGFVPYPEGLVRPGKRGNRVLEGGILLGGERGKKSE